MKSNDFEVAVIAAEHDEAKVPHILNGAIRPFPGNASLTQFFSEGFAPNCSRINPENIALIHESKKVTFAELESISSKIAALLFESLKSTQNSNPDGDSVIAICIPPSTQLVFVLFAIHKLGAAYVPIDVSFPEERVSKIVKDCRPLMVISESHGNYVNKFDKVKEQTETKVMTTGEILEKIKLPEASNSYEPLEGSPVMAERTAIILYTSGSSGEPKGVRLNHRTVMNRLSWQWHEFPFGENEKCAFKTSLTFVDSVPEIFGPLLQGHPLVVFDKQVTTHPSTFIENLSFHKITRLTLVPSFLRAIFQTISLVGKVKGLPMLGSVKLWVCSGEPLPYDLFTEFFDLFPENYTLANFYGSTEVMGDVTYVPYTSKSEALKKVVDRKIPIGKPVDNTVIYILDKDMNILENGAIGEIYIAGFNLATNYVGGTGLGKFIENGLSQTSGYQTLYRTGDYGKIQDGMLFYEGRVDSQVKVRGQRIDLAEIELNLSEIELISKVVVLCYHPGESDQAVLAYVVRAKASVTQETLKPLIEKRLRDYETPLIIFMDQIPLLVNGKTDRQRLLKSYESSLQNREEFDDWAKVDLPKEKVVVAKALFKTMSQVTGTAVETFAEHLDNSFFNVGGTSLNAVTVVVKLRQDNWYISVGDFAGAKTIRDLVYALEQLSEGENVAEPEGNQELKKYSVSKLTYEDKEDVLHTIAYSFSKKGDMEAYTKAAYEEFRTMIGSIWAPLVEKEFSFVVRTTKDGKCAGASLNFDLYDEPEEIELSRGIQYALEVLEHVESRQKSKLPNGKGKVLHSFMMGTSDEMDEAESVAVIETMEEHNLKLAEKNGFIGVMTTNTNALTRQVCLDIYGYELLSEFQVNTFTAEDGTKPFFLAPDSFTIACCWKKIGSEKYPELDMDD